VTNRAPVTGVSNPRCAREAFGGLSPSSGTPGEGWGGGHAETGRLAIRSGAPSLTLPRITGGGNEGRPPKAACVRSVRASLTEWKPVSGAGGLAMLLLVASLSAAPATQPTDPALWAKLTEIDSRAGKIKSLSANFEQQKFTALLRKPLESSGTVRINGSVMRWDTKQPEPSVLWINGKEAKVYYPNQKSLEIYPMDRRMADLAASPLPRLDVLKARFAFRQIDNRELDKSAPADRFIALELTPTDPALVEHVKRVRVLLDVAGAYIMKAEMTDSDGDRTVLSFRDVQLNAAVGDLALAVPPGTAVTRPLEGLDGQAPPRSKPQGPSK
jgi:outer membrane lipoprotein-sorting protein